MFVDEIDLVPDEDGEEEGTLRDQLDPREPPEVKKGVNLKLSCIKVYHTNAVILLVKIMLCSNLYRIEVFRLKLFSYESDLIPDEDGEEEGALRDQLDASKPPEVHTRIRRHPATNPRDLIRNKEKNRTFLAMKFSP